MQNKENLEHALFSCKNVKKTSTMPETGLFVHTKQTQDTFKIMRGEEGFITKSWQ